MNNIIYRPGVMAALSQGYTLDEVKDFAISKWNQLQERGKTREEANAYLYDKFGLKSQTTTGDADRAEFISGLMFEPFEEGQTQPSATGKKEEKPQTAQPTPTVQPSQTEIEGKLAEVGVDEDDIATVSDIMFRPKGEGPQLGAGAQPQNLFQSFLAGYENSTTGLFLKGKTPDFAAPGPDQYLSTAMFTMGQMIGDMPTNVAGFLGGGAVGGPVGAFAGAMGLSGALRQAMLDSYNRGECTTPQEFFYRTGNALKAGGTDMLIGAATAGAGIGAGAVATQSLKASLDAGSKLAKTAVLGTAFGAEAATMSMAPAAIEGRMPTMNDFISGTVSLVGLKAATQGGRVIQNAWVKYGWAPERVPLEFKTSPGLAENVVVDASQPYRVPTRDVYEVSTSLDRTYAKGAKDANQPESNSGAWLYFSREEAENVHLAKIAEDKAVAPQQRQQLEAAKNDVASFRSVRDEIYADATKFDAELQERALRPLQAEILEKHNIDIFDPDTRGMLYDMRNHGTGKDKKVANEVLKAMDEAQKQVRSDPEVVENLERHQAFKQSADEQLSQAEDAYRIALAKCPPDPINTPYRTLTDRIVISSKIPVIQINGLGSGAAKVLFDKFSQSVDGKKNAIIQDYLANAGTRKKGTSKAAAMQRLLDAAPNDFIDFIQRQKWTVTELKKMFGDRVPQELVKPKIGDKPKVLGGQELVKDGRYNFQFGGIENNGRFLPFRTKSVKAEMPKPTPDVERATEKIQSSISYKPDGKTFQEKWNDMRRSWTNRVAALNKGAATHQRNDSYVNARMIESSSERAASWLEIGAFKRDQSRFDKDLKPVEMVLRGLTDKYGPKALDKLAAYLTAENTVNTAQKGKPVVADIDSAKVLMRELRADPEFYKAVQQIEGNTKALISFMQEHGLISSTEAKELSTHGPIIPMTRLAKSIEKQLLAEGDVMDLAKRAHLSEADAENWRAAVQALKEKESGGELVNPLETMIANTYVIMRAAMLNETKESIAKDWGITPGRINEESGVAYAKNSLEPLTKVTYKSGGKNVSFWVQKDIYDVVQTLDVSNQALASRVFKALTAPTSWLRAGVAADPVFSLRNLTRDQFGLGMQSRFGLRPFVDMFHAMGLILKGKWSKDFDNLYQEARRSGGLSGTFVGADRRSLSQKITDLQRRNWRNVIHDPWKWKENIAYLINPIPKIRGVYRGLQQLSETFENVSRIGEYEAARKAGYTPKQAAFMMRESTLDFSKAGVAMRGWNCISAFANARMQGFLRSVQAARENPTRFMAAVTAYVVMPTLLFSAIDADFQVTQPDSDYANASRERQPWHRAAFWMIPTGDAYSTPLYIPKPQGIFGLFTMPFEMFIHKMAVEGKFNLWDAMKDSGFIQSAEQSLPFGPSALMPTAVTPAAEVMSNYSFFKENAIVPSRLQKLLPEEQYVPATSSVAKTVSKILTYANDALGGYAISDKLRSPMNIDHLIKSYSGTLGKHLLEIFDTVSDMTGVGNPNAVSIPLSRLPIVKEFTARYPDYGMYTGTKFFDEYKKYTQTWATVKFLLAKRNATDAERAIELTMEKPIVKLTQIERALSNLNRSIQMMQTTDALTGDEKRQYIDQALVGYVQIARNGLNILRQYRETWEKARNVK